MKKVLLLVVLASILLMAAAPAGFNPLVRLQVLNKTDQDVHLQLAAGKLNYYLSVASGTSKTFTIERDVTYKTTIWACGLKASGYLFYAGIQHRFVFPSCYNMPYDFVNGHYIFGEPSMPKLFLINYDTFHFQY